MMIQSRTIVGAAGALAIVGAALWASSLMTSPPSQTGHVEVQQVIERSWAVEVKDLGNEPASPDATKTAAVAR
jgi:hypothetical protein